MAPEAQKIFLIRHGETEWSRDGKHTGVTDVLLTEQGRKIARLLQPVLAQENFVVVLSSPLQRARETCELAGLGKAAAIEPNLMEWNYGDYEGKKTVDIRRERPDWQLFRDGCPGGESPADVGRRADAVIEQMRAIGGNVLLFSSGHFFRVFAARWLGLEPAFGRFLLLSTATLSILGYEHDSTEPVLRLWNDNRHVTA
jgi:probable phosphoglycerate mutase